MNQPPSIPPQYEVAKRISADLSAAAHRLEHAGSFNEFVAAVEAHRNAWLSIRGFAPTLRAKIPERMMRFSLAAPQKFRQGLSDYDVEVLIRFDRFASDAISEAASNPDHPDRRVVRPV
jgi:hypothetical protein